GRALLPAAHPAVRRLCGGAGRAGCRHLRYPGDRRPEGHRGAVRGGSDERVYAPVRRTWLSRRDTTVADVARLAVGPARRGHRRDDVGAGGRRAGPGLRRVRRGGRRRMKLLLAGITGQLGTAVAEIAPGQGVELVPVARGDRRGRVPFERVV